MKSLTTNSSSITSTTDQESSVYFNTLLGNKYNDLFWTWCTTDSVSYMEQWCSDFKEPVLAELKQIHSLPHPPTPISLKKLHFFPSNILSTTSGNPTLTHTPRRPQEPQWLLYFCFGVSSWAFPWSALFGTKLIASKTFRCNTSLAWSS